MVESRDSVCVCVEGVCSCVRWRVGTVCVCVEGVCSCVWWRVGTVCVCGGCV